MIVWRLRVVMAERDIGVKELAGRMGMTPQNVSRLKNYSTMPWVDGDIISDLCTVLTCHPADLMVYVPDDRDPATRAKQGRRPGRQRRDQTADVTGGAEQEG